MALLNSSGAMPRALSAFSVLSVLRIFTGLELLEHGTSKILGFPAVPSFAHVQIGSLAGAGGVVGFVGGILFTIGLVTRPGGFLFFRLPGGPFLSVPPGDGVYSG